MTSATSIARVRLGSETVTEGVRVAVHPSYSSVDSDPANNEYRFVYRIRITNERDHAVQLLSRHWIIVDGDGERQEVRGEGVVGQQPVIEPGHSFEYSSFCPLGTSWGTMEGSFTMGRHKPGGGPPSGQFAVRVARFFLVCPPEAGRVEPSIGQT